MDVLAKANVLHALSDEQRLPKGSNEKTKMLDITRDRPVKVAVKVAVPVRDHPKFNFVGKLLGPKGNSLKRLQEETMCKMAVLGRGSMRDRKKEEELRANGDSRYAHLFEDLHVEISTFAAPAEAHARIAYALAEVRRFLVPDYHDDIRQEQMWEMQALTSSSTLSNNNNNNNINNNINAAGDATVSPKRMIEGGITDMDTSNDEKSDNELTTSSVTQAPTTTTIAATIGMDCSNNVTDGHALRLKSSTNVSGGGLLASVGVATATTSSANTNGTDLLNVHHQQQQQQHHQLSTTNTTTAGMHHPSAMAIALQHQLTSAAAVGLSGLFKPTTASGLTLSPENDTTASTYALLDPSASILHPALRNVKTINIAGNLTRKRPLLGVPRSSMNPTKRTVMTLLARAKNSQAFHAVRNPVTAASATAFSDPLQMLASPFLIPHHQAMEQTMLTLPKESLAQGV